MGVFLRFLSAILLLICAAAALAAAFGAARAAMAGRPPLRGELVDIGGRRLRMVCEGPASGRPLIVMESGIFGFAADWAAVQKRLAERGLRSCAYDRAGLGFSDPGPYPRDGLAIVADLEALLKARGETGPLILVGHSMAGLHARLFALRNPQRVKGLVLVDAASPDAMLGEEGRRQAALFRTVGRAAVIAGRLGLMRAAAPWAGDPIGLDGPAHAEKVYFWADTPTIAAATEETFQAPVAAAQARAAGRLDPELPVAAITEGRSWGASGGASGDANDPRLEGARRSRHGWSSNLPHATHASMLGPAYAPVIADGVEHVLKTAGY